MAVACRVTVIEAKELLGTFDGSLREYAARKLVAQGVKLRKGVVKCVEKDSLTLTDNTVMPFGLCIWSTGVGPTPFTLSLPFAKTKVGRIAVDKFMQVLAPPLQEGGQAGARVRAEGEPVGLSHQVTPLTKEHTKEVSDLFDPSKAAPRTAAEATPALSSTSGPPGQLRPVPGVYALGDCCANTDQPLPPLAQVAEQQGKYLAHVLNEEAAGTEEAPWQGGGGASGTQASHQAAVSGKPTTSRVLPFKYKHLGSMATVGGTSAVLQLGGGSGVGSSGDISKVHRRKRLSLAGFISWVAWRSAYLTRLGTMRARLQVAFDWTITLLFGRDLSRW